MNGIEKITARIIADAEAEAAAARADAEAKCSQIRADYDKKAQDEYWRTVRAGVKDCEARVQRLGRTAEMEAKKSVLALKQDMVSRAFDSALERVLAMPEDGYAAFPRKAVCLCRLERDGGDSPLRARRASRRQGRAARERRARRGAGHLTYKGAVRAMPGGAILRDGDIEINSSLDTLLTQYRYELSSQVAEVLFG